MFEGEKTAIFFTGLFILGASLFGLFTTLWVIIVISPSAWKYLTPSAFGATVFLIIGYYLMTIGVKKPPPSPSKG